MPWRSSQHNSNQLLDHDVLVWIDADISRLTDNIRKELPRAVSDGEIGLVLVSGPLHVPNDLVDSPWRTLLPGEPIGEMSGEGDALELRPTLLGRRDPIFATWTGRHATMQPMGKPLLLAYRVDEHPIERACAR